MGEIAELILDGSLCQVCGGWMGEWGEGYPRTCEGCKKDKITIGRITYSGRKKRRGKNCKDINCPYYEEVLNKANILIRRCKAKNKQPLPGWIPEWCPKMEGGWDEICNTLHD